jgi:hypothetical protein
MGRLDKGQAKLPHPGNMAKEGKKKDTPEKRPRALGKQHQTCIPSPVPQPHFARSGGTQTTTKSAHMGRGRSMQGGGGGAEKTADGGW